MSNAGDLARENQALRQRLSRLSEASLRINESLDLDTVLQEVVDSARALTGSRYGVITTLDDSGLPREFVTSGVTSEDHADDFLPTVPDPLGAPLGLSSIRARSRLLRWTSSLGRGDGRLAAPLSAEDAQLLDCVVI